MDAPDLTFRGAWYAYQSQALETFEADLAAGRRETYLTAPPGSGKTLLGWACVARLRRPALVLAPNAAIQSQWPLAAAHFTDDPGVAGTGVGHWVSCLTYQSLCQLDDPEAGLEQIALERVVRERARELGADVDVVRADMAGWRGEARRGRDVAVRAAVRVLKREIARGEGHVGLDELLTDGVRERVRRLQADGVATLVLDECHHLASMWGYVVEAVVEQLGDVHVIGLTATPPRDLTGEQAALYERLLGPVDFGIPTPAVVREGKLAPYQELAYLCEPTPSERDWLTERHQRFDEFLLTLHDQPVEASLPSFHAWVRTRLEERSRSGAQLSWPAFVRAFPELARAGVRYLHADGTLPTGAPRSEGFTEPLDIEDWIVLLSDYLLRCLVPHPGAAAAERIEALGDGLRALGYAVTRRGIRTAASDVDRTVMGSAAKLAGLDAVLRAEADGRGDGLRALVLCDTDAAADRTLGEATGVQAVLAWLAAGEHAWLRPVSVTGTDVRCGAADAEALCAALGALDPDGTFTSSVADGVATLSRDAGWSSRRWVPLVTELLVRGDTRLLVGTRALLGEGWNCPQVNCMVDLTSAATSVTVQQMRGRALRLDPGDPDKVASNWSVVCVAPELSKGHADYRRLVRRHEHIHAPAEDGTIERGVSHVHPALSPVAAPTTAVMEQVSRTCLARAGAHAEALERWAVGTPFRGVELTALVVRGDVDPPAAKPDGRLARPPEPDFSALAGVTPVTASTGGARADHAAAGRAPGGRLRGAERRGGAWAAGGAVVAVAGGVGVVAAGVATLAALPVGVAAAGVGWVRAGRALEVLRAALPQRLDLARSAFAVAEALVACGELDADAAGSLTVASRADGYLRVLLEAASPAQSATFSCALDEALTVGGSERHLVSRLALVEPPDGSARRRVLTGRLDALLRTEWHPVPAALARTIATRDQYLAAMRRWYGPGELVAAEALDPAVQASGAGLQLRRRVVWE